MLALTDASARTYLRGLARMSARISSGLGGLPSHIGCHCPVGVERRHLWNGICVHWQ